MRTCDFPFVCTRISPWLMFSLVAGSMLFHPGARADDEGIYGKPAPPDSAFVRIFNPSINDLRDARIANEVFPEISAYETSEWVFLPPGRYTLSAGAASQALTLEKGLFYTAVLQGNGFSVHANERYRNRLKALIILYNETGNGPLSLRTADGKTPVIENVAEKAFGTREVNAIKTGFSLYRGSERIAEVRPVNLERGKAFSLFLTGSGRQPMPTWVVN